MAWGGLGSVIDELIGLVKRAVARNTQGLVYGLVISSILVLRAAQGGHKAVLRLLLEKGADLEAKDCNGRMLLHVAT